MMYFIFGSIVGLLVGIILMGVVTNGSTIDND